MDLFESFDNLINDKFIEEFKAYLGEERANYNSGIKGIYYIFLSGLIRRSYSEMSSGMLFSQIKKNAETVNLPENLADLFGNEEQLKDVEKTGSRIISQLFPAYRSPMISSITTYSGMSKNATSIASRIVANVLVQLFNSKIEDNNWTVDDLVATIRQHHEPLLNIMPENFQEIMIPSLGLQDLLKAKPFVPKKEKSRDTEPLKVEKAETSVHSSAGLNDVEENKNKMTQWIIIGIMGLLLLGGGAYYYFENNGSELFKKKSIPVESSEIDDDEEFNDDSEFSEMPEDYISLKNYILDENQETGKSFSITSIKFDSTSVSTSSVAIVDSIAHLMETHPNLQFRITSNITGVNGSFKINRSFSVKKTLMEKGVEEIRIDPTAGNEDEEKLVFTVVKK